MNGAVYVGGTFDLFHAGHVELLRRACAHGPVVVSVNTDAFVERYKRKPIMTFQERIAVVRACKYVDLAVRNIGHEKTMLTILELRKRGVGVSYILRGDDWEDEAYLAQIGTSRERLEVLGIELLSVPYTKGVSTSDIIRRCWTAVES